MMAEDEHRRCEEALQRALDNPMPRELRQRVADLIEPQTMNAGIKHDEVMMCIAIAFPAIRDWLRGTE